MDRREQKKQAATHKAALLRKMRESQVGCPAFCLDTNMVAHTQQGRGAQLHIRLCERACQVSARGCYLRSVEQALPACAALTCACVQGVLDTAQDKASDRARADLADSYDDFDMRVEQHWTEKVFWAFACCVHGSKTAHTAAALVA